MSSAEIKKIIYSILKEVLEGDDVPTYSDYNISKRQYFEIVSVMCNEGYLNRKLVSLDLSGNADIMKRIDVVTMKGIDFLEDNSKWNKFYKGIKEFRNFLPM